MTREERKPHPFPKQKAPPPFQPAPKKVGEPQAKLGPTGQHIRDILPEKYGKKSKEKAQAPPPTEAEASKFKSKVKGEGFEETEESKKASKSKFKEFRDVKPTIKQEKKVFDSRDRQGLRTSEDVISYRKRKGKKILKEELPSTRPTHIKIHVPISVKDLASEMKLKSSELIGKMFLHGLPLTINQLLDDDTVIQLAGQEFGCQIVIDTAQEKRIRITDETIQEEIKSADSSDLLIRSPVVAFMGHVDHGKTSLIDAIRKSNRVAGEAGAITQHIGAFRCQTAVGDITILDTPGHEAFSSMRSRGANVTDIVVLVVAGDEGIKQQTVEAISHAKQAKVTIVVAINKSDKPNFNPENVYRQLADHELLPEAWGGSIITVNCSAVTGAGIETLLEMLALQAEVLELRANPAARGRGTLLESEMHKGLGPVATVLIQNGTLKKGDAVVCDHYYGRIKTLQNEYGEELSEAGPSYPVAITGLSGLPEAGQEIIVVKSEKEAKEIAEARMQGIRLKTLQKKTVSLESMLKDAKESSEKKILNIVIAADVQGSLEALKAALEKIHSDKIDLNIVQSFVGEVSESIVQLAQISKAIIVGFHTQIESHAANLVKQLGTQVRLHDIIYHAIDDVKAIMKDRLDKIPEERDTGKAEVKATFKSSQFGIIAGCMVTEGVINRNHNIRVKRGKELLWRGSILSLKRVKEDVKEVQKGLECGIVLNGFDKYEEGDVLEAYDIIYLVQEL